MATIVIPTPLRKFSNNVARINVNADNVSDAVLELTAAFPDLEKHLIDTNGKIAPFINIFVDDKDIRNLDREKTNVKENGIIFIIPAIAGGIKAPKK
jgi:molybdopterin synthase sulfur carrier subunit